MSTIAVGQLIVRMLQMNSLEAILLAQIKVLVNSDAFIVIFGKQRKQSLGIYRLRHGLVQV